jgi:hypothetical protein
VKIFNPLRPLPILGAWLLLAALHSTAAAQTRVVAIGDVHGALPEFESILKETGLLDAKRGARGGWAGGKTVFVQLGDLVDGGAQTRACLDLAMALEQTSVKQKKGKVVTLLGDHEFMAMTGDMNDVSADDYKSFATSKSEMARQDAYRDYQAYLAGRARAGMALARSGSTLQWMAAHPLGYFERRDAFGPQGVYGRWLRQHDVIYQNDGVAFVHGGLSPNATFESIDEMNAQMRGALRAFDKGWQSLVNAGIVWRYMTMDEAVLEIQRERAALPLRDAEDTKRKEELDKFIELLTWLVAADNPVRYRGLAEQPEQILGPSLQTMMARLKITTIVAGHSVAPSFEIAQRFDNRVVLIDTGMLKSVFGGKASALEIENGRFTARSIGQPPRALAPHDTSATTSGTARP